MTNIDLNTQSVLLKKMLTAVTQELETIAVHNPKNDDWEITNFEENFGEADDDLTSDNAEAAEESIATLALLETRYRNIKLALTKIESNTYGICEISGGPIEAERLVANPAARTCIEHMEDEPFLPLE